MASRIHWSDLAVGVASIVIITAIVVSILLFARVGALHGDTTKIYVTAPNVSGVLAGTDVWIAGKKVGQVSEVRFLPVTSDTLQRVVMVSDILNEAMPLIRKDSWADIRPGGNLIGSPVVYIKPGTASAAALRAGDTLASRIGGRIAAFGSQVDSLANKLTTLANSSGKLVDKLSDPTNSVGAFRSRGVEQLRDFSAVASGYATRATRGSGTAGLAYRGALGERVERLMAAKDSIMFLVSSGSGNVGRFRKDSTLKREVASVRAGIDSLSALTSAGGTANRLRSDTALTAAMARARAQIDSLMVEIKKHPLRYISF